MNKITNKKNLTTEDVKRIEMLGNANLSRKQIEEITGWSSSVIGRILRGVYYEEKEKKRIATNEAKKGKVAKEEIKQESDADIAIKFLNNISNLLFDIDKKLKAICDDLDLT